MEPNSPTVPPVKENGIIPPASNGAAANGTPMDTSIFSQMPFRKKKSPLRMGKKVYEFYNAPVTKFWAHAIGYMLFLVLFCYVILERLKPVPTWAELYIIAFIFTMALEKIRQIIASEPVKVWMKLRVYISQLWNILDTLGISMFAAGLVLRCIPSTLRDGQLVYTVDIIFWNIRILEILSVNKYLGPYVKIIGKLLRDMCYFLTILFIAVTSFGLVRQAVHFQNKEGSWHMRLRNVWYYPYWMIYGELFAEEIDPCDDPENNDSLGICKIYAAWLAPFLMFVFLLVANILMVNLLIARFNATFIRNNANSKEIWMFQRYGLILQYEVRPILPPPFILITHIYLAFKYIKRRCKGKRDFYDNGLKLFLSHEDTEKLHDFEEECMEDLYREKDLKFHNSSDERVKIINERVENMSLRLDDMNVKENHLRLTLATLDHRMSRIDEVADSLVHAVRLLTRATRNDDMGSQESLEDAQQFNPPPYSNMEGHPRTLSVSSSEPGDRNQPSPMLVHSKNRIQTDQLSKFTNYARRRQLSGSEFPIEESDQFVGEGQSQSGAQGSSGVSIASLNPADDVRFSIGASDINNSSNTLTTDVKRRSVASVDEDSGSANRPESSEELSHKQKIRNFASQSVRFVEPIVHSIDDRDVGNTPQQPSINVTARLDTGTHTVSQKRDPASHTEGADAGISDGGTPPEEAEANPKPLPPVLQISIPSDPPIVAAPLSSTSSSGKTPRAGGKLAFSGQPLVMPGSIATSTYTPISMPQSSACFTANDADLIPQSAARDLSSMLNPLIGEYTSITDTIDTSCIEDCSPPRSPTSSSAIMFSVAEGYHEVEAKLKERSAADNKQQALKQAEETEHQRMEYLIRHRLRQISQKNAREWAQYLTKDESGSISDIARVVVAELAAEDKKLDESEESEIAEAEDIAVAAGQESSEEGQEMEASGSSHQEVGSGTPGQRQDSSDLEEEATEQTRLLFRDRVRIRISQPSQDTASGDSQSLSKFPC
ncbi:transient receptor potential cation channel trpm [Aplysia californica]|uniref:Transient receptor potential cation channel trpm n=1 Tax=Aplysia californica TaxID=6500 RepID=A0ABM1VR99_APLCA|nr:transient receptor potential cation channel trpm [Aplysia californica]